MIEKRREIPIEILKDKALLRRTSKSHPRRAEIEENVAKRSAGYYGELASDRELRFLPENEYHIFHDLRLPYGQYIFQIDTLILSEYFSLINEIKNMIGTLHFEPTYHQLIRTNNGVENNFKDPITQAKRQKQQLERLFQSWNFGEVPIEYMVAISNPSTKISVTIVNPISQQKVCYAHRIPEIVEHLRTIHRDPILNSKELKKLCKNLIKSHTPKEYDPLQFYCMPQTEIIPGVQCPKCLRFGMTREQRTWLCLICTTTTKFAHIPALIDYSLLISPTITNRQCRQFLQLPSASVANYILTKLNLSYTGSNKGRIYELSYHALSQMDLT